MKAQVLDLINYEKWALQKIIKSVSEIKWLEPDDKIIVLISHILLAQQVWLQRLTKKEVIKSVWENLSIQEMEDVLIDNLNNFISYVDKISTDQLESELTYSNIKGDMTFTNTISEILSHLSIHSAYHRGQVVQLLKETGVPLPSTDYIVYCREK